MKLSKKEQVKRNEDIHKDYISGMSRKNLMDKYHLSRRNIAYILVSMGDKPGPKVPNIGRK